MADWATISALATAGGTLVLAGATFASVRSAHTSARVTERALLAAIRPLLLGSRIGDQPQKVRFRDDHLTLIEPGRALVEIGDDAIYLAFGVRKRDRLRATAKRDDPKRARSISPGTADHRDCRPAAGRQRSGPTKRLPAPSHLRDHRRSYGDHEGGQRVLSRFLLTPLDSGNWLVQVIRHWNVDRPDPR